MHPVNNERYLRHHGGDGEKPAGGGSVDFVGGVVLSLGSTIVRYTNLYSNVAAAGRIQNVCETIRCCYIGRPPFLLWY